MESDKSRRRHPEYGLIMGIAIGVILVIVFKRLTLGLLLGLAIGILLFRTYNKK